MDWGYEEMKTCKQTKAYTHATNETTPPASLIFALKYTKSGKFTISQLMHLLCLRGDEASFYNERQLGKSVQTTAHLAWRVEC
jgi:hypothetical protein